MFVYAESERTEEQIAVSCSKLSYPFEEQSEMEIVLIIQEKHLSLCDNNFCIKQQTTKKSAKKN
jgi:hypothetical protein